MGTKTFQANGPYRWDCFPRVSNLPARAQGLILERNSLGCECAQTDEGEAIIYRQSCGRNRGLLFLHVILFHPSALVGGEDGPTFQKFEVRKYTSGIS